MSAAPQVIGQDVVQLHFSRGLASPCRLSLRVSHDGAAPVLSVAGSTTWLTADQAREMAVALLAAADIDDAR